MVTHLVDEGQRRGQIITSMPYYEVAHLYSICERAIIYDSVSYTHLDVYKRQSYYGAGMFTEFMEQRGPGHTAGGKNFYIYGYGDYKKKIAKTIDELDFLSDPEAYDKLQELKAMDICCDAVKMCIRDSRLPFL